MSIAIKKISEDKFEVTVSSTTTTKHIVTQSNELHYKLTKGKVTKKELLDFSFKFLLEREPNQSILPSFELRVISQYFTEFENVALANYNA